MLTLSKGMLIESNLVSTYIIKVESFEKQNLELIYAQRFGWQRTMYID